MPNRSQPRRIHKTDTHIHRTSYGWGAGLLGLPFVAMGGFFALAGFGWIALPGKAHVPLWVVGWVGVVFALSGLTLVGYAVRGALDRRRAQAQSAALAGAALADYPWDPAGISDANPTRWLGALAGVLLLGALLVPFNWVLFGAGADGPLRWLWLPLVLLFDLVWLAMLGWWLYLLGQALKWRRSRLLFEHFPFSPGESVRVQLVPHRLDRMELCLRFVQECFIRHGSGDNRSTRHEVRALHEQRWSQDGRSGRIAFTLPDRPDWVNRLRADPDVHYWELELRSAQPGIDYHTCFLLPVYPAGGGRVLNAAYPAHPPATNPPGRPYAFELALPLVFVATLSLLAVLAPHTWQRLTEPVARAWTQWRVQQAVHRVAGPDSEGMAVQVDGAGRVWALGKRSLVRTGPDDPDTAQVVLDAQGYRVAFGESLASLSALAVGDVRAADDAPGGAGTSESPRLWLGGWHGELLTRQDGRWQRVASRGMPLAGRVHAIAPVGPHLLVAASDGLWRWTQAQGLVPVPLPMVGSGAESAPANRPDPARVLWVDRRQAQRVFAAVGRHIWRSDDEGTTWGLHAQVPGAVHALLHDGAGGLWVGHDLGLGHLAADGLLRGQALHDAPVYALAWDGQRLWASVWGRGLRVAAAAAGTLPRPHDWRRLDRGVGWAAPDISALAVDGRGALWAAAYGAGLLRIDPARLWAALPADPGGGAENAPQ